MLRSRANTLVSVRQVTQRNTGRKTAGIDGLVALTTQARAEMAVRVHQPWARMPSPRSAGVYPESHESKNATARNSGYSGQMPPGAGP